MTTANITRDQLQKLHVRLSENARQIMAGKNLDYAKDTDPLRNFRMFEELGIVVRMSDKVARLRTFCERGILDVKDESVEDTLVDIINYSVLFAAYILDRQGPRPPAQSNVIEMPKVEPGPFCDECEELADFVADDNSTYICSNCAAEKNVDITGMGLLEQVG